MAPSAPHRREDRTPPHPHFRGFHNLPLDVDGRSLFLTKGHDFRGFAEPSDGLEPSTPSLPWNDSGNWSQPTATVLPSFPRLSRRCDLLPVVSRCARWAP